MLRLTWELGQDGGEKMYKKALKYFSAHPYYNSFIHLLIGIGVGILITYPFVGAHPIRWGVTLVVLGLLAHAYPLVVKK